MFAIDPVRFAAILKSLQETCIRKNLTVATAESCTGGLLGALLTHEAGSSAFYRGGVSTYANEAKIELLQVEATDIDAFGAVSATVAQAMAAGIRRRLRTDFSLSLTGIAGPGGGSAHKPVGTVYCGWSSPAACASQKFMFEGDREEVRAAACWEALRILRLLIDAH